MALRKVAVMGHPVLRQAAKPVPPAEIASPKIQNLINDMYETMFEYDGRGLAAPQVHESLQIVVMLNDFDPEKEPALVCLINPVIKPATSEQSGFWEGCLSVPGLRGWVERPNRITLEALDRQGKPIRREIDGFEATVIQHECDHLLGKLYIDRMTDLTKLGFNKEFGRFMAPKDAPAESEGEE